MLQEAITWLTVIIIKYGAIGLFIAMILQSVISPIPSELLMAIGGATMVAIYGTITGVIVSFIVIMLGAIIGAIICYWIGYGGEKIIHNKIPKDQLEIIEIFMEKHAIETIIIARLMPFLPFDAISYVAGFLRIPKKPFTIATIIGLIPRILFYTLIGAGFAKISEKSLQLALIYAGIITVILLILFYFSKKYISKRITKSAIKEETP